MPENTLSGWENRIRNYATVNELDLPRTTIRRAAKTINKRFEQFNASTMNEDDLIAYVLQHSDPTGETAARNVDRERNAAAAARRLSRMNNPQEELHSTDAGEILGNPMAEVAAA